MDDLLSIEVDAQTDIKGGRGEKAANRSDYFDFDLTGQAQVSFPSVSADASDMQRPARAICVWTSSCSGEKKKGYCIFVEKMKK